MTFWRKRAGKTPAPTDESLVAADVSTQPVQYITPYRSQALSHDGWEHAHTYHYMMQAADNVRFVVVLPQHRITGADGTEQVVMYHRGYDDCMWSLVDARESVRKWGFLGFVLGGARCAEASIEASKQ